jgi:hypothetical protein
MEKFQLDLEVEDGDGLYLKELIMEGSIGEVESGEVSISNNTSRSIAFHC